MKLRLALALLLLTSLASARNIKLKWTASTTPNITGNNVYRGTVHNGPYTKIGTVGPVTTYTDATADNKTTYYYVVTAYLGTQESVYSNEAGNIAAPGTPLNLNGTVSETFNSSTYEIVAVVPRSRASMFGHLVKGLASRL